MSVPLLPSLRFESGQLIKSSASYSAQAATQAWTSPDVIGSLPYGVYAHSSVVATIGSDVFMIVFGGVNAVGASLGKQRYVGAKGVARDARG